MASCSGRRTLEGVRGQELLQKAQEVTFGEAPRAIGEEWNGARGLGNPIKRPDLIEQTGRIAARSDLDATGRSARGRLHFGKVGRPLRVRQGPFRRRFF